MKKIIIIFSGLFMLLAINISSFAAAKSPSNDLPYSFAVGTNSSGTITAVVRANQYHYQLQLIDTYNPQDMKILATVNADPSCGDLLKYYTQVIIKDLKVYIMYNNAYANNLQVFDISNLKQPQLIGNIKTDNQDGGMWYPLAVENNNVFLVNYDHWAADNTTLQVYQFDASGKLETSPVYSKSLGDEVFTDEIEVYNGRLYVRSNDNCERYFNDNLLTVFDVSNPTNWTQLASYHTGGSKLANFSNFTLIDQNSAVDELDDSGKFAEIYNFASGSSEPEISKIALNFIGQYDPVSKILVNKADNGTYMLTWASNRGLHFMQYDPKNPTILTQSNTVISNGVDMALPDQGTANPKLFVVTGSELDVYPAMQNVNQTPKLLGKLDLMQSPSS